MKYFITPLLAIFIISCSSINRKNITPKNDVISYPYIASPVRQKFILDNYSQVKVGQTANEVKTILGTPEKTSPWYEARIYKPKQIGFTFIYLLQQLKEHGSQNDKAVKLVRISFDLKGKVSKIDQW